MRVVVVGCEYSGVTTLINGLMEWGNERGIHHHEDDHFTIPDAYHLTADEQQAMVNLPPALKERFQRFQLAYHVHLMHKFDHILMGGFHIEEAVYGHRYYYPGRPTGDFREYEADLPDDVILVHLSARPEVIRARKAANPHPFSLIREADVPELLAAFRREVAASWIRHKLEIDTSDLTPAQLRQTFLERSMPHLGPRDLLLRLMER